MALEFYNALKAHAENFSDKTAIIDGETILSYGELLQNTEKFAGALDTLNPGPKSKLAILSVNQNEFIIGPNLIHIDDMALMLIRKMLI